MASLKGDTFLQFTISSGNKFQSLIVAGKKECLKVSVVQMGSLSDFELLIRVFLVLKCRCVSAGIATVDWVPEFQTCLLLNKLFFHMIKNMFCDNRLQP